MIRIPHEPKGKRPGAAVPRDLRDGGAPEGRVRLEFLSQRKIAKLAKGPRDRVGPAGLRIDREDRNEGRSNELQDLEHKGEVHHPRGRGPRQSKKKLFEKKGPGKKEARELNFV